VEVTSVLSETITAIDPVKRRVNTKNGTYHADVLVVALGAGYDFAATHGFPFKCPTAPSEAALLKSFDEKDRFVAPLFVF